jgi:hypothetical protein
MKLISHGRVEADLTALRIGTAERLWSVTVRRVNANYWTVGNGRPLMLLESIDSLMKTAGFRVVAGVDEVAA